MQSGSDNKLEEFKKSDFFIEDMDADIEEDKPCVHLHQAGKQLVEEYYRNKYKTNITVPTSTADDPYHTSYKFLEKLKAKEIFGFEKARKEDKDYRHAFIIGKDDHSFLIVYIKENRKEAFLYANSLGINASEQLFCKALYEQTQIPIYGIVSIRQADGYSCHTDALVLSRDITAIDPDTGQFKLKNLLLKLRPKESKIHTGFFESKLPNELLITTQLLSFLKDHRDNKEDKILDEFRARYTEAVTIHGKIKNASSYLRIKGLKYMKIIEIQFYINQIAKHAGDSWNEEVRKQFIKEAKTILIAPDSKRLHPFAEKFLSSLKADHSSTQSNESSEINYYKVSRTRGG